MIVVLLIYTKGEKGNDADLDKRGYASYAAATPDEEGIGQHDYQSNNDSDHRKTPLNAKKERPSRLPVGRRNERSLSF